MGCCSHHHGHSPLQLIKGPLQYLPTHPVLPGLEFRRAQHSPRGAPVSPCKLQLAGPEPPSATQPPRVDPATVWMKQLQLVSLYLPSHPSTQGSSGQLQCCEKQLHFAGLSFLPILPLIHPGQFRLTAIWAKWLQPVILLPASAWQLNLLKRQPHGSIILFCKHNLIEGSLFKETVLFYFVLFNYLFKTEPP